MDSWVSFSFWASKAPMDSKGKDGAKKKKKKTVKKNVKKASFRRGNRARNAPAPAEPSPDPAEAAADEEEGLCPPGNSDDEVPWSLLDSKDIPHEYQNTKYIYIC